MLFYFFSHSFSPPLSLYPLPVLFLIFFTNPTSQVKEENVDPITCACVDPCLLPTGYVWTPSYPLIKSWLLSQQADGLFFMQLSDSQHWPLCTPLQMGCLMTLVVAYSKDRQLPQPAIICVNLLSMLHSYFLHRYII